MESSKRTSKIIEDLRSEKDLNEMRRNRASILIAGRIITAIKQNGLTKLDFAKRLKKSPSIVSRWLSGTHNFTSDTLSDIEVVLGIELLNLGDNLKDAIVAGIQQQVTYKVFITSKDYSRIQGEGASSISLLTKSNSQKISRNTVKLFTSSGR